MSGPRPVRAPRGTELSALGWQQEAALRMLQNNLDPEVAEHPDKLVVYGGTGKAARDWRSFDAMVRTLRTLKQDETMLGQSGRPVGVMQTHEWAPRVLIANSNLVGDWANWEEFRRLEALGLTMYGQMTAGSWMLSYAETVLAARREAELAGAVATFGKISVEPNGVNAIPSLVRGWLDSRAADQGSLDQVVGGIEKAARAYAEAHGIDLDVVRESFTPVVEFDHALRDELARILGKDRDPGLTVPVLGTGAGHDAGILSGSIPTSMLFVRNPTGVSHSPAESAAEDDCVAGVLALADVLEGLACR